MRNDKDLIKDNDYYDELLRKRIGEALRRTNIDEPLQLEELRSWAETDKRKKALKRRRYVAAAASFVLICAVAFCLKTLAADPENYAVAGNENPVVNENGDSAVVKNNEEGVEENLGKESITIKRWKEVLAVKKEYTDLMVPEYVPEGYEFVELKVEGNRLKRLYTYIFKKNEEKLLITQSEIGEACIIKEYDYTVGKLYIKIDVNKSGYCYVENALITITGELDDKEYVNIVDNLRR